jgi:hypothetical protein
MYGGQAAKTASLFKVAQIGVSAIGSAASLGAGGGSLPKGFTKSGNQTVWSGSAHNLPAKFP